MSTGKRLTPAEWAEAVTAYERGEATAVELARRYGVSRQAISAGLAQREATFGSRSDDVRAEAEAASAAEREERLASIRAQRERFNKYNDMIATIAVKKLAEAQARGDSLGSINGELRSLRIAGQIIATARKENWDILRIDPVLEKLEQDIGDVENDTIEIIEYDESEINEIRDKQEKDYQAILDMAESGDDDDETEEDV